jgi:hypothetical protein
MRATLPVVVLAVVVVGCGVGGCGGAEQSPAQGPSRVGAAPSTDVTATATDVTVPTVSARPTPTSASYGGVAVPTCLGPEVRPEWWTPNCGDAGYQLTMRWDTWTARAATAHGSAGVTHGQLAGRNWLIRVRFDHPRRVKVMANRLLFSRAVVTYLSGRGPDGTGQETMDLASVWRDAAWIAAQPVAPCTTDADGVSNCADVVPSAMGATPSPTRS